MNALMKYDKLKSWLETCLNLLYVKIIIVEKSQLSSILAVHTRNTVQTPFHMCYKHVIQHTSHTLHKLMHMYKHMNNLGMCKTVFAAFCCHTCSCITVVQIQVARKSTASRFVCGDILNIPTATAFEVSKSGMTREQSLISRLYQV